MGIPGRAHLGRHTWEGTPGRAHLGKQTFEGIPGRALLGGVSLIGSFEVGSQHILKTSQDIQPNGLNNYRILGRSIGR